MFSFVIRRSKKNLKDVEINMSRVKSLNKSSTSQELNFSYMNYLMSLIVIFDM